MRLYLIPSPIGNLGDITYRAVEVLKLVDCILCEDTRNSVRLLNHYGISKPISPYHQHNEHKITDHIVAQIKGGKSFALLTDAGTPGISDPGYLLVKACRENGIMVECLPGATALIPAIVQSGLPCTAFVFEGFPPLKKGRQTFFNGLALEPRTIVLYEAPYRLAKTLLELAAALGKERLAAVCRELTKLYEETKVGTLGELGEYYEKNTPKGEIVIVISGKSRKKTATEDEPEE
ncbi:MAG: 16S rRNA (cytidine(1402)-2'-O)-methyltransferase [Chitinophagia bacterium]|nr:16S rRNA (cytidine(1402)-2'-O)-methyltransferase [Chitinophagia bacterium]